MLRFPILLFLGLTTLVLSACAKPPAVASKALDPIQTIKERGNAIVAVKATLIGEGFAFRPDTPLNVVIAQRDGGSAANIGYTHEYLFSSYQGPRIVEIPAGSYYLNQLLAGGTYTVDVQPFADLVQQDRQREATEAFQIQPGEVIYLGELEFIGPKGIGRKITDIDQIRTRSSRRDQEARAALGRVSPEAAALMKYRRFNFP